MGTNCDMGTFGDEVNRHPTYLAFTAPRDAYYVVRTCDQDDDTRLSILTACGDASSVVACDDDGCDTESGVAFGSSAGFRATAGVTYFIGIGAYSEPGYEAPLRPVLVVDIAEGVPPADSCASPVAGVLGMNMLATDVTAQDLVMGGFCDMGEFGDEVNRHPTYIRFVPPQTRFYRARTCAQAADTRMSVLATCGEASSVLGCDDDACGAGDDDDLASSVTFQATAGVPVFIAVGAYSEPGYTAILPPVLAVEISEGSQPPPPLDPCDPSRIIAGQVGVTQVIPDPEYPNLDLSGFCSFPFGAPTLGDARYVSFTPSKTGLHVIGNCGDAGSTVDARLAVLEQCGVPASTVACDDDGCSGGGAPYTARIEVLLEAGKTYFVAVGRFDASAVGPFNIEISEPAGPPCPADLNGDGAVTGSDLGLLLGNWGFSGTGDLNGDGTVSGSDLGLLLGGWGACP
jgi:hypothetical protein